MNKFIALVVAFVWSVIAAAQTPEKVSGHPCNDPSCRDMKFQYVFCDANGNTIRKCSSDPNNEPGMRPYKQNTPIALCPENLEMVGIPDAVKLIRWPPPSPLNPGGPVLFSTDRIHEKLMAAKKGWDDLCPSQSPSDEYQICCLRIAWASTLEEMRGEPTAYANMSIIAFTYDGDPASLICQFDCHRSVMLLNRSREFMQPLDDGTPRRYFLTERENIHSQAPEFHYEDLQALFEHELGHWLGFMHTDQPDDDGDMCYHTSMMYSGQGTVGQRLIPTITAEDACMFMKAYCCEQTMRRPGGTPSDKAPDIFPPANNNKLAIGNAAEEFSVAPNPLHADIVTLRLHASEFSLPAHIHLVDASGKIVLKHTITNEREREFPLDMSTLHKGMYMVQLISPGWSHAQKILVE